MVPIRSIRHLTSAALRALGDRVDAAEARAGQAEADAAQLRADLPGLVQRTAADPAFLAPGVASQQELDAVNAYHMSLNPTIPHKKAAAGCVQWVFPRKGHSS